MRDDRMTTPPASGRADAPGTPEAAGEAAGVANAPSAASAPAVPWQEFARRRDGMVHAMDGGLWLHRHVWKGTPMAHLVSTDREALLAYGRRVGLDARRLQFKPLRDPRTEVRRDAWHWDLVGRFLPPVRGGGDGR